MFGRTPVFTVAVLALQLASALTGRAGTITLDLKGALERAPEANFQILLGKEGLATQEQAVRIARSGLLPQVELAASQSRSMVQFNPIFGGLGRLYPDNFDAVLRARLALLDSRAIDDFRIAKLSLRAANWQLEDTVQEVLRQIAVAYLSHWRNERRMRVIDANLERDRLLLQMARDQQEAGVATALDVTRAEVRLASNELARLQQETAVMESALFLKQILNLPMGDDLVLTTDAKVSGVTAGEFSAAAFANVLASRPDYQRTLAEVDREALSVAASKRERLPSLELSGEWGYDGESWSDSLNEHWTIQIGASMPVFEGFRIDAQSRVARSALRQREIELEDLKTRIESDYRLVLQQLQSSAGQVEVAHRARDLSEREFDLERIRFEQGVADNSDVVDAQARLAAAEDSLVEAEFQYFLARVNRARAEGDVRKLVQ